MTKYLCDCCKEEVSNETIVNHTYSMPRRVLYYATSQGIKLYKFDKIETRTTLLCDKCIALLADTLITIE